MKARLKSKAYRWKKTALAATKRYSLLRAQLRRSRARVKRLEAELAAHRQASAPIKIAGHRYPAQLIALAVFIVVQGNGSLRCAAKTVGFVSQLLGWSYGVPSHASVRRWVLRIGLDHLHYGTEKVGEYVAIVDEIIQISSRSRDRARSCS